MHIYFHRDFDGVCSAAVLAAYLKATDAADSMLEFLPVDYDLRANWAKSELKRPCAIVDFLYHPDAEWWFDHHQTAFVLRNWQFDFRPDSKHQWRTDYESCPRLILDSVTNVGLREKLYRHFAEYLKWCDVIDGAHYSSASQVINMAEPALRINATLRQDASAEYLGFLIDRIEHVSLAEIADTDEVGQRYASARAWQEEAIQYTKSKAIVVKDVAFIDLTDRPQLFHRYAVYYLWPDTRFQVALYRQDALYKITVSMNPWRKSQGPDLGAICDEYGGGGHSDVAGILLTSKRRAHHVSDRIAGVLRGEVPFYQQLSFQRETTEATH